MGRQAKTISHRRNTSYNTTMVLWCKISSTTVLAHYSTASKHTGKFAKMVHPDFFGKDGGRNFHQSDLEN